MTFLSIRRAAAVGLGLVLAATALWASGEEEMAEAEFVTVDLTKKDGTTITRELEKPRYGGMVTMNQEILLPFHAWEMRSPPHELANLQPSYQRLLQVDWYHGPSGTGEVPNFLAATVSISHGLLAESWEYPDGSTLIIKLREGVHYWSKEDVVQPHPGLEGDYGREFTAHDAAYARSLPTWQQTGVPGNFKWEALDDHTLQITWPGTDATEQAFYWSQYMYMFPQGLKNVPEEDWTDWRTALGTGPFIPTDVVPASSVTYKRNPNYWEHDSIFPENQLPYADQARIIVFDDEAGIVAALRAGQIDLTTGLGIAGRWAAEVQASNPDIQAFPAAPTNPVWSTRLDLEDNPFRDIKVRQALMLAIPRKEILEDFYNGLGFEYAYPTYETFTDWFVPRDQLPTEPREEGSCASARQMTEYHPDLARQCLADAGYPDGLDFDLVTPQPELEFNELYAGYWNEVGLRANIKVVEQAVWQSTKDKDDTFLGLASWTPGWWQQPYELYNSGTQCGHAFNSGRLGCDDPRYDEGFDYIQTELDPAKVKEFYTGPDGMFAWVLEKSEYMMGVPFTKVNMWNPWVKGYNGELSNVGIQGWHSLAKQVWIDTNMQP